MKAGRTVHVAFALLTLADAGAWHDLVEAVRPAGVAKAAYERDPGKPITVRALDWQYKMLPAPSFIDERTLVVPPGQPIVVSRDVKPFRWRQYEDRGAPFVLVVAEGGAAHLARDGDGRPVLERLGESPPPVSRLLDLLGCFDADQEVAFDVTPGAVQAGRCRWDGVPSGDVVVQAPHSPARIEVAAPLSLGERTPRWWLLALVLLGSVLGRLVLRSAAWAATDAAGTLLVLGLSFVTPFWIVLWCAKDGAGALAGAVALARGAKGRALLAGTALVVVAAAWWVDPVRVAATNTAFNERSAGRPGDTSLSPPQGTTHVVLGYSVVNGAALARGSYGEGALDQQLAKVCGRPGRVFARHAVDGANACFMADHWNEKAAALPALRQRVVLVGFNDDLTAAATRWQLWVRTLVGLLPLADPQPRLLSTWDLGAKANLEPARAAELLACLERLARGTKAPLLVVNDLPSFDLGRERAFGRQAWAPLRLVAVEGAGGSLVDMRALLPGESPVYFNDVVHPSEVGYQAMAAALCPLLQP